MRFSINTDRFNKTYSNKSKNRLDCGLLKLSPNAWDNGCADAYVCAYALLHSTDKFQSHLS